MNEKSSTDYSRLIAAQNEHARMLKIKSVKRTLSEEDKKKSTFAMATGVCLVGLMVATHFSGIDIGQAIQTEIQALSSFEALREYLKTITPAMWGTMLGTALNYSNYIRHNKKYKKANAELDDMLASEPEDYLSIVEGQARK